MVMTQHSVGSGNDGTPTYRGIADRAYRRAWWSLALYPVAVVAGFVLGEGLLFLLTGGEQEADPPLWAVLLAGVPALLVMVVPGVLAVLQGRRARKFGRSDGWMPAVVGAVIGIAFSGLNGISLLLVRILG